MNEISVEVALRPIRFGFLVRPDDDRRVRQVFEVNTCLWGGRQNPIIPIFKRIPQWWARDDFRFENAKQIVNGYLNFFEPDFVVEAEPGLAQGLGFDEKRVLALNEILAPEEEHNREGCGQSVLDLYRSLYEKQFQFSRRHKTEVLDVEAKDSAFRSFAACIFGAFPRQAKLKYFHRAFRGAFDASRIRLDAPAYQKLLLTEALTALSIGRSQLAIDRHPNTDPVLFVVDAERSPDLIDYWNYRAVFGNAVAVPRQWLKQLSHFNKSYIKLNYRPLPGNPYGTMIRPTVMFGRTIGEKLIEDSREYVTVDISGANTFQTWYPSLWRPTPEFMHRTARATVTCVSRRESVAVDPDKPAVRFESLSPDFADRFGGEHRWANVVQLKDWSFKNLLATVFPSDFRNPSVPQFRTGLDKVLPTTEGLVTFPKFKDVSNHWELTEGADAIGQWLKAHDITATPSDAGRATTQIIQTLGGFMGVRSVAVKGVIKLLDEMARTPITRSAHHREFENKITIASTDGLEIFRGNVHDSLIERNAVQLGFELKCPKCAEWSWYSITELSYTNNCGLCLRSFAFPIGAPSNSKHSRWAYRVIGPFALPNYAKGGYAPALALRFLGEVLGHGHSVNCTWAAGQELVHSGKEKLEADFILWFQRTQMLGPAHPTEFVFGEAKSFGKEAFEKRDFQRMRRLAELFPGAVLVFATMKEADELSRSELAGLRSIAEWGREYDRDLQTVRAPVVVLTGTELFTPAFFEEAWRKKGGLRERLVSHYVRAEDLRTLADLTQQAYLGLPSRGNWLHEKAVGRAARAARRTAKKPGK